VTGRIPSTGTASNPPTCSRGTPHFRRMACPRPQRAIPFAGRGAQHRADSGQHEGRTALVARALEADVDFLHHTPHRGTTGQLQRASDTTRTRNETWNKQYMSQFTKVLVSGRVYRLPPPVCGIRFAACHAIRSSVPRLPGTA